MANIITLEVKHNSIGYITRGKGWKHVPNPLLEGGQ